MKTITITYISSRKLARLECDRLLEQHPEIKLVALTAGANPGDVWLALSQSEVAVIDEEMLLRDGGETLTMLIAGNPFVKFLAVMKQFDKNNMLWAISRGVRGVMLRRELSQLLGKAIKRVSRGEVWMPRNLFPSLQDALKGYEADLTRADGNQASPGLRLH
jgi:DNA-binding NarL/FixJ family response regulator